MGIARPSIYAAFGDKQALFLRSLERYQEGLSSGPLAAMSAADGIEAALTAFLERIVENATCDATHPGCLMASVAAMVDDPAVRTAVAAALQEIEDAVAGRLAEAVAAGELPPAFPVARGARRATDAMLALSARARTGATPEVLLEDAADGVAAVLALRAAA